MLFCISRYVVKVLLPAVAGVPGCRSQLSCDYFAWLVGGDFSDDGGVLGVWTLAEGFDDFFCFAFGAMMTMRPSHAR